MAIVGYTGENYASFIEAGVAAGIISFIQQVEFVILSTAAVRTFPLPSSVDPNRTAIFYTGPFGGKRQVDPAAQNDHTYARVNLTGSGTTLTATRGLANGLTELTVLVTVVEYIASAVDSVQHKFFTYSGLSDTDSITSVDDSRSVVIFSGTSCNNTGLANGSGLADIELTNGTTVTSTRGVNPGVNDITVSYNVIQFAVGIVDSVQKFNITIPGVGSLTADAVISGVVLSRTFIFPGGYASDQSAVDMREETCYAQLFSTTVVRATRQSADSTQPRVSGTVVQFATGIIKTIQRDVITHATNVITQNTTVTAVVTSLSMVIVNGAGSLTSATIDPEEQHFTLEIVDPTTIGSTRGVINRDIIYHYELVEYVA